MKTLTILFVAAIMMDLTKDNKTGIVNFCLNYGSHAELTDAMRRGIIFMRLQ